MSGGELFKVMIEVFETYWLTRPVAHSMRLYRQTASLGSNGQLNETDSRKILLAAFCTETFYIDVCGNDSNSCLAQTNRGCTIYVAHTRISTHCSFITGLRRLRNVGFWETEGPACRTVAWCECAAAGTAWVRICVAMELGIV